MIGERVRAGLPADLLDAAIDSLIEAVCRDGSLLGEERLLELIRSVTTTMKMDIDGYAIMTSITESGISDWESTLWMTNTQAIERTASFAGSAPS